jgi:hypothetical protein
MWRLVEPKKLTKIKVEGTKEMSLKRLITTLAAGVSFVLAGACSAVQAQTTIQLGVLDCDISAGFGLIFTEKQTLNCVYTPDNGGVTNRYTGSVEEFGLELGATSGGVLTWVVLSAEKGVPQGALAGTYVGLSANASVGVGLGANALNGGFNRAYILQPYSVQTQTGMNVAAGISKVTLRSAQ